MDQWLNRLGMGSLGALVSWWFIVQRGLQIRSREDVRVSIRAFDYQVVPSWTGTGKVTSGCADARSEIRIVHADSSITTSRPPRSYFLEPRFGTVKVTSPVSEPQVEVIAVEVIAGCGGQIPSEPLLGGAYIAFHVCRPWPCPVKCADATPVAFLRLDLSPHSGEAGVGCAARRLAVV
jgi:hypothetical protein